MNEMTTIDWICFCILMFSGAWKLKELIDIYAPKTADWIIQKIQGKK